MKNLAKILMIALVFTACEDEIDLDVPEGPVKMVVDGSITNLDSLQRIRLTTTSSYFDPNPTPALSGAEVVVTTDKMDSIIFYEVGISGNYEAIYEITDTSLIYTLHISAPNGKKYQSYEEILNRVPPIDSLVQSDEKAKPQGPGEEEEAYFAMLNTHEPKGTGDYYRWIVFIDGEQSTDPFDLMITDDRMVDGNDILNWDIVYNLLPEDTLTVHQTSISQRAYNYWGLIFAQITKFGGPFDTPPAPIEGNIFNVNDPDDTVLGFFGVSNVESATIIIVEK
jgi:hypothetical protein